MYDPNPDFYPEEDEQLMGYTPSEIVDELRRQARELRRTTLNRAVDHWKTALQENDPGAMVTQLERALLHLSECVREAEWMLSDAQAALTNLKYEARNQEVSNE